MKTDIRRGLLIILSSPSGAGKSTLSRMLIAQDPELRFSVSATTRAPRRGEVEGQDYFFKSRGQFETMIENDDMLEHAEVFGNLYGSPRGPVEDAVKTGHDVIFDVDWQGGQQLRASHMQKDVVSIFILPPSIKELERRLVMRAQDSADVVAKRMAKSRDEISHWAEYDFVLINDDLDVCFKKLLSVLRASRLRRDARPELMGHVTALNKEFEELSS